MKTFFTAQFVLPLPAGHRFPMSKYHLTRALVAQTLVGVRECAPTPATREELLLAHDVAYVERVLQGTLTDREVREIGFPWSLEMVERSLRSVGATIAATDEALADGVAVNLAGGTHHAYADRGSGFCVFNDAAVAALRLVKQGRVATVAIVDLDVHQGNGSASILAENPSVVTLSLHGARNFPFRKEVSDIDVSFADGTEDTEYLRGLERAMHRLTQRCSPDLLIYLAGADPYAGDRLGRLSLTQEGLLERDRMVFQFALARRIPVAVAMAGGYGRIIEETAQIHARTVGAALEFHQWWKRGGEGPRGRVETRRDASITIAT